MFPHVFLTSHCFNCICGQNVCKYKFLQKGPKYLTPPDLQNLGTRCLIIASSSTFGCFFSLHSVTTERPVKESIVRHVVNARIQLSVSSTDHFPGTVHLCQSMLSLPHIYVYYRDVFFLC